MKRVTIVYKQINHDDEKCIVCVYCVYLPRDLSVVLNEALIHQIKAAVHAKQSQWMDGYKVLAEKMSGECKVVMDQRTNEKLHIYADKKVCFKCVRGHLKQGNVWTDVFTKYAHEDYHGTYLFENGVLTEREHGVNVNAVASKPAQAGGKAEWDDAYKAKYLKYKEKLENNIRKVLNA